LGGERQELTTPRRWRLRHLAGNPFPCRNPRNPPLYPRFREGVSSNRTPSICRYFSARPQISPIIRVGEVPGSNPGAPIKAPQMRGFFYALIPGCFGRFGGRLALPGASLVMRKALQIGFLL
jgi:hypothetical protein